MTSHHPHGAGTGAAHRTHGLVHPTNALRDEHVLILRALAVLDRVGADLRAGQPADPTRLASLRSFFVEFADRCHHRKEEQHLFPALTRHGIPKEGGPVGVMLEEHEEGRACLRAMAQGDDREVAEAIRRYVALLRAHIDKENGVLFPLAEQVLGDDEQRRLAGDFEAVERELMGPGAHERLVAELAALEAQLGGGGGAA